MQDDKQGTQPNLQWLPRRVREMCVRFEVPLDQWDTIPKTLKSLITYCAASKRQYQKYRQRTYRRATVWKLWQAADETCYICGNKVPFNSVTVDHVFPRHLGFGLRDNLMPSCKKCNGTKGHAMPKVAIVKRVCETYDSIGWTFDPAPTEDNAWTSFHEAFGTAGHRTNSKINIRKYNAN